MSSAETRYTARAAYPATYQRGRIQTAAIEVYRDGALVAPTSGTYTLYKPDGSKLVDAQAVTVTSSVATYSLASGTDPLLASTLTLGEGYLEVWALTISGVRYDYRRQVALAMYEFHPVVTDADIEAEYPDLDALQGTALSSWQGMIDQAWKGIIDRLRGLGHYPYLIMSPESFRRVHIEWTLYLIFRWASLNQGDRWATLREEHKRGMDRAWSEMNFVVDTDHDGFADSQDRRASMQVVHVNGSPQRAVTRSSRW